MLLELTRNLPPCHTHIGQMSMSYRGHECTQQVVSWLHTYVPNLVYLCQTAKMIFPNKNSW